jgi:hypothetical protein
MAIIFTLIIISVFSAGSFFIYSGYLASYKANYKAFINKKNVLATKISINPSQLYTNSNTLVWEDDNKEVVFNGVLYDVVSISSNKGKVVLTVLSDLEELEIKKNFASTFDVHSDQSTSNPIKLLKQFFALKYLNDMNASFELCSPKDIQLSYTEYSFSIQAVFLSKETLPPSLLA